MTPLRISRHGLSRVEVVVVIVLAAFVLGLGSLALLRSQAAARRLYCANNLREIGQATFRFQEVRGFLPPSRVASGYATWAVLLAPYLEKTEGNSIRTWDVSRLFYEQEDATRRAQVVWFYCPARREPPLDSLSGEVPRNGFPKNEHFPGALGDYAASAGDGTGAGGAFEDAEATVSPAHRVLSWSGRTSLQLIQGGNEAVLRVGRAGKAPPPPAELKRGTSSTVLLGEKHVPWGGFGRTDQGDGSLYNGDYPDSYSRVGGVGFGLAQSPGEPFNRNFGSVHPGVCQFLMADDSVRPLAVSISPEILGKLMVREQPE
jgi:hypothetical protein